MQIYRFTINTSLTREVACQTIRDNTFAYPLRGPLLLADYFAWWKKIDDMKHRPFEGDADDDSFTWRLNYKQWSFLHELQPLFRGKIRATANGTQVEVAVVMGPFTLVAMGFWLFYTGCGVVGGLTSSDNIVVVYFWTLLLLVGSAIPFVTHLLKSLKARRILKKMLTDPQAAHQRHLPR